MFPRRPSGFPALIVAGIAVAMLIAILSVDQYHSRQKAVALKMRHIEQNDRMLAENIGRSFEGIDILLDELRVVIQERSHWQRWSQEEGHQILKSRLTRSLPQIRHLLIFDAEGRQRHTSFSATAPQIQIQDRPYFVALANGDDRSSYGPYVGRNSNRPTYALARRLGRAHFEGALVVAIEPDHFNEFCLSSRPHNDFETALVNAEGRIIAMCRSLTTSVERKPAAAGDDFRLVFGNGRFVDMPLSMNRSTRERGDLILSTEPVPGYPQLRVVTVTPRSALIEEWQQQAIRTIFFAGLSLFTLIGAGLLIRSHMQRLAGMTSQLRQAQETLEERVEGATRELESRRNEAVRLADSKSRFFAAASHDLRQPLHAMQLFLADLSRSSLAPEQRLLVDRVDSAAQAIANQLGSLLEISRLDMSNITPQIRRTGISELFAQLAAIYSPGAEAAGNRLVFHPNHVVLETDPALLVRLIGNLVDNAIKFAPHGSVLVCARYRRNAVRIEVRDNGRGIPHEHQAAIFDEFFQVENRARDPGAGLGLGLAIAQRIARLLGANIGLRSAPGRGSVFSLTLPSAPEKKSDIQATSDPLPHIVVVGLAAGDEAVRELTERARRWGYEAAVADNMQAAWRLLDQRPGIAIILHTSACQLGGDTQSLLRNHRCILITAAECDIAELGPYHLREPVKPARLRAVLRSLH